MSNEIIVDFDNYGLKSKEASNPNDSLLEGLGEKLIHALKTFGFCYLTNHGINENLVDDYIKVSTAFFDQPNEIKEKYRHRRTADGWYFGWNTREKLNPNSQYRDLHETFSYQSFFGNEIWPDVENFEATTKTFFESCNNLAYRVCDVISLGLSLPQNYLRNAHRFPGQSGNSSGIRLLYYPSFQDDDAFEQTQARLGEHVDCGTLSFIFQDDVGGLEVKRPGGDFMSADPVPGTLLLLIGGQLARMTSDYLPGTLHRIHIPEDIRRKKSARKSINYFLLPDNDYVLNSVHGSNKYKPMTSLEYLNFRIREAFPKPKRADVRPLDSR